MRYLSFSPEDILKNERMTREEQIQQVYANDRMINNRDYNDLFRGNNIPNSLLVQTFMRKLQDGLERRRP